jgi:hypothetical protein
MVRTKQFSARDHAHPCAWGCPSVNWALGRWVRPMACCMKLA